MIEMQFLLVINNIFLLVYDRGSFVAYNLHIKRERRGVDSDLSSFLHLLQTEVNNPFIIYRLIMNDSMTVVNFWEHLFVI